MRRHNRGPFGLRIGGVGIGRSHPKPYLMPGVIEFLGHAPWSAPASLEEWLVMARRGI